MIDPKLQKLVDKIKAREAGAKTWLERNWEWLACGFAFVMGVIVGRLL
jgi:hypothetical protein